MIEMVNIGKGSSYCRSCYRARKNNDSMKESSKVSKAKCNTSRLGYKGCGEQVCGKYWESYDHKL